MSPDALSARSIEASLTVKDLAKSVKWYTEILGFTKTAENERDGKLVSVAIAAGDIHLRLNQDDGKKGWDRVKGQGLSLQFTTTGDLDAVAARAKKAGATLGSEPADMPWGARIFRITDPDGFAFTVSKRLGA